jgi:VanZ family protein
LHLAQQTKGAKLRPLTIIRIVAWSLAAAITVLSVVPPGLRPETGAPHHLEHFIIFAVTGLAFGLSYRKNSLVAPLLVVFSGSVEVAQLLVPGRHARLSDFVVDAVAACFGLLAASLANRSRTLA